MTIFWPGLLGVMFAVICVDLMRVTHWSVAAFALILLNGMRFEHTESVTATVCLIACIAFFLNVVKPAAIYRVIYWAFLIAITLVLAAFMENPYDRMGLLGNSSMNGCFIAVSWPLVIRHIAHHPYRNHRAAILSGLAIIAIFLESASIPIGVMAVTFSALILATHRAWAIVTLAPVTLIAVWVQGPKTFFHSSGRFIYWQEICSWWWSHGSPWFGTGNGTFQEIFRIHGVVTKTVTFAWAHNDYLQLFIESGIIGCASLAVMVFFLLKRVMDRPYLFASIIGYLACAVFNFPTHLAPTAFLGCALIWLTYREEAHG